MLIKSSVALVTGASSGIGKAIAIALAQNGASVIIHYHHNKANAEATLQVCNKYSHGNIIVEADITNDTQVSRMIDTIEKTFGKIDVLVNNAGVFDKGDKFDSLLAFENLFQHNLLAHIRVIKKTLPLMKKGKIINISSIQGRLGSVAPQAVAYSSLKAALNVYTKNLASELAPNILVNAIAPGKTLTPMWGNLFQEAQEELASTQLINRFIQPEEIAEAALFLIKNDAITGSILDVDGGMSLKVLG